MPTPPRVKGHPLISTDSAVERTQEGHTHPVELTTLHPRLSGMAWTLRKTLRIIWRNTELDGAESNYDNHENFGYYILMSYRAYKIYTTILIPLNL